MLSAPVVRSATASDLTHAWSCATSFEMCQASDGSGAAPETRRALVQVHAQQLLVATAADPWRLDGLAVHCRYRARAAARWRAGWAIALRRRRTWGSTRWAFARSALTRASRHDIAARWTIAADLAEAALTLARAANAHTDLSARARLVTETERVLRAVDWHQFSGHSGYAR